MGKKRRYAPCMRTLHRSTGAMLFGRGHADRRAGTRRGDGRTEQRVTGRDADLVVPRSNHQEYVPRPTFRTRPKRGVSSSPQTTSPSTETVRDHVEREDAARGPAIRDGRRERLGEERESLRLAGRRGVRRRRARIRDQRASRPPQSSGSRSRARRRTSQSPTTACGTGPTECGSRRPAMSPFATTRSAV